tara:strand:- start:374 stop:589 length:216 start_codon:yes stop_codon:yes gene_type:complete
LHQHLIIKPLNIEEKKMVDKKFADAFKAKLQQETGASQEWMDKHLIVDFGSLTDDDSNDQDETETETDTSK